MYIEKNINRVYAKPYKRWGTVVKVSLEQRPWNNKLERIYWVKLDNSELRPRGFSASCLTKNP